MLYIIVLCGGTTPFVITFGALYTGYDVTYVILELLLTDPLYRGIGEIYAAIAIRILFVFFLSLEGARSGSFFACFALCGIDHFAKIVDILRKRMTSFLQFLRIYTNLRLHFGKIWNWVFVVIYLGVGSLFWATVGCVWCCVKCYGKVPWPLYYASMLAAVLLIFGHLVLFPPTIAAAESCIEVVEYFCKRMRLNYAIWKSRSSRVHLKQGNACAPIKFKYGIFWVIRKAFGVEYFCLLLIRTFDAILILKF